MNLLTARPRARLESPTGALSRMREEMEKVFDRFVLDPFELAWYGRDGKEWMPMIDVAEATDAFTVRLEIPGVMPKDVDVSVSGNILTISGKKEESKEDRGENYFIRERRFGAFRRSIELPEGVDAEKITATQENGVLTVKVARLPTATPKHIPVRTSKNA